jgi:hypothetical protein
MENGVLMLKPLHRVQREGSLLGVYVQTCMLLGDNSARVVLQVEQVRRILGHVRALEAELQAGHVTHMVVVLLPHGLLLIPNQEECKRCVGGVDEIVLTERCESNVRAIFSTASSRSMPMTAPRNGAAESNGITT